jgi:CRISPR-associated protein Cmr1
LLLHLGGLGSRSRRGAGSLQAISIEFSPDFSTELPLLVSASTPAELVKVLSYGLKKCIEWIGGSGFSEKIISPSGFDIIHPSTCKIWVLDKVYDSSSEALNELGTIYQHFRNRREPDARTVGNSLNKHTDLSAPIQRAAFGLPIPFFFMDSKDKANLQTEHFERRASPLWFKIVRLSNAKFAIVLTWFNSEFLPEDEKLKLAREKRGYLGDQPDDSLISEFILGEDENSLKSRNLIPLAVKL